jgi:hypothetical protein
LSNLYFGQIRPSAEWALDNLILPGFASVIDLNMEQNWHLSRGWEAHSNSKDCQFQSFAKGQLAGVKGLVKRPTLEF